ncbi:MAG TPA: AMP-binding protein [Pseudonocardiaceae bacterium]
MEISGWIRHWANWSPSKTALRFEGTEISYRELEDRVARLAGVLSRSGTTRGDRVAYLGPNCPELVEALFACARLGAIFVPLNARMPPAELRVFVRQSTPRTFLAEHSLLETARASAPELAGKVVTFSAGAGFAEPAAAESSPVQAKADPSAVVLILFTSGTTGTPKGAVMTHAALAANAVGTALALGMNASDEILTFTPMFHIAGLNLLTTPALFLGATVTVHRRFDPGSVLRDIQDIPATLLLVPPPMTRQLAAHPTWARTDLAGLRVVMTGGTTVTERSIQCFVDRGVPIVQGYGMTETGTSVSMVPIHDTPSKTLTAGKPTLGSELRVVDGSGRDVAPGRHGEIAVRGPSMMQGYWQNSDATDQAIRSGWLHTGDLGFIDEEGYLHVVDRIKEIIIVGVSNVSPADLEAILAESPDIEAAAVVGRPDEKLGEVPVVFVVPAPGRSPSREQVLSLFEGRLAPYKHPREVIFLDALPRTSVGKPEKETLRALARRCPDRLLTPLAAQPTSPR